MEVSKASTLILSVSYYGMLVPLAFLAFWGFPEASWIAIIIFWAWVLLMSLLSALVAKYVERRTFLCWYEDIFLYGVRPIARNMIHLYGECDWKMERFFELWWCFCIKYVFPWAMYWLLIMTIHEDTEKLYENYHIGWQFIGLIFPIIGILIFTIPVFLNKEDADGSFKEAFAIKNI